MQLLSYALVQLNDAKSFLSYSGSDDTLIFLINATTEYIEKSCNRRFAETTYQDEQHDGNNSEELVVKNIPITAITELQVNNSGDSSNDWETIDSDEYWVDRTSGIITKTSVFRRGTMNYQITYTAGFTTIPYDVQFLAMSLIKEFLTVKSSGGIKQESLGDHSITFESILQSNKALKDILNSYRLPVLL